jgi:hypothetical protein
VRTLADAGDLPVRRRLRFRIRPFVQPVSKNISVFPKCKSGVCLACPVPLEGRLAIVTNAGRDAVDAGSASDEGVILRTAKSCGPDAPTLASSFARGNFREATVARKPGHRGERGISRKTIARGMPGDSGVTVVTTLVCFFHFAHKAAGAASARHSLRPLFSRERKVVAKLGREARRDRGRASVRAASFETRRKRRSSG